MIQKWIKNRLALLVPQLEWTVDFKTGQDHTGVVYVESPGTPDDYDARLQYPTYQIELESSKRAELEVWAHAIHDNLDRLMNEHAVIIPGQVEYEILYITAVPPLPIGMDGKKQIYTINLQTTVRKTTKTIIAN